jgi:hypothetical protein
MKHHLSIGLALVGSISSLAAGCARWEPYTRDDFIRDAHDAEEVEAAPVAQEMEAAPVAPEMEAAPVAQVDGSVRIRRRDGQRETLRAPVDLTEHEGALWARGSDGDTVAIPYEQVELVETRGPDGPAIAAWVTGGLLAAVGIIAATFFMLSSLEEVAGAGLVILAL